MNKKIVAILLFLVLLFVGSFCIYADDTEVTNDSSNTSGSDLSPDEVVIQEAQKYLEEAREISEYNEQLLGVSASGTTGFHSVVLGLLGNYEPIVKDYIYQSTSSYQQHSIEITPDYSWIASAAIFALVILCVFKLIGSVISGVFK